jgi:hypothetical protein
MYNIHKTCKVTNDYIIVNQEAWVESMQEVKS